MYILFYHEDGAAAKVLAQEGRDHGERVRVVHSVACREREEAKGIAFMPDVPEFERNRLEALFEMEGAAAPERDLIQEENNQLRVAKGPGGRIYLKRGKEIHSGPFEDEAMAEAALAKEQD